jgi:hypothetical protein
MNYKQDLVNHLKSLKVKMNVHRLWGESKEWAENKGYCMGGSYASWGSDISVNLLVGKERIPRFEVHLNDLK